MRFGTPREPALVLFLCVITCGLYYLYFIYKVSQEIEDFQGHADYSPGLEVLLTIVTFSLWNYYWDYRVGKRMAEMAGSVGLPATDNSIIYIVLNLCGAGPVAGVGLVNAMIQQDMLNRIWIAVQSQQL
jgi:hypothetical protein